jgi:eukaryotic-like serine/threonine-protein kinase
MKDCPDQDLLERLVCDRVDDTVLDELGEHLNHCASCQQILEELSDDTRWRRELRREVWSLVKGAEPGHVVDPLGVTAGASSAANERTARAVPTVPGYEITHELGRGGMGVVYHARHIRLNRSCALKMILAGAHAGPGDVARFVTEAEAIARLEHPSIVQIRHIGDADGLPFLELEYLAGGSLDGQLDGTPWPSSRAARLAEQVALAIALAHRQGIVHRDLKPSNVLLAADGTPKVGDFGLAKMLEGQSALTRSESVMGSPSYMAPEQAQGRAKEAGPAVDVYAVGAILYELLTGRPPFRGTTTLETLEQVQTAEPVPPSRLVPGVPRDVETICLKCLQKEPGKRYESSQALAEDLRRFLDGRPILGRRTSGVERAWRWCRRNRFVAGMTAIAAAALFSLAVGATIAAVVFRAQDRETRVALWEALMEQASAKRYSRQAGQRFGSLDALDRAQAIARELKLPPERFDRIRDQVIACLALPDAKPTGRKIALPAGTLLYCFDSGMKRYALRLVSGTILVRRVADDQEVTRRQARGDRGISVFAFSPDGRYLTTTHSPGHALTVWDIDQDMSVLDEPGPVAGTAARFSPDSRRIALAHPDGEVLIYDLQTRRSKQLRSGLSNVQDLAFRADGLQIAITGQVVKEPKMSADSQVANQPTCHILDVESGRVVRPMALRKPRSVAWSPNGATLAAGGEDRKVDLWDVDSETLRVRLEGSANVGLRAAFHPAGTLVASNGWENVLRLWDATLGRPVLTLTGESSTEPVFSSGGQIVVRSDDSLTTYQVDPAPEYRALIRARNTMMGMHRPSIRRDSRLLAVGNINGVGLWDLAHGTECAFLPIPRAFQIVFQENGDLLTRGAIGVQRWPVQLDTNRNEFRIGPPVLLPFSKGNGHIAVDRLGQIIAAPRRTHAEVLISGHLKKISPLDECRDVALSPDGEWLATSGDDLGTQVWRVRDAQKVADLPVNAGTGTVAAWRRTLAPEKATMLLLLTGAAVAFSPDGKWLMTARPPCKLWTTGTWDLGRELGGTGLCFSPDSRLVAILDASRIVRLVAAETGRVIARIESPESSDVLWATFSPDGSRLVLAPNSTPAIRVWDLRMIRKRLAAMDLDWAAPAYPDEDPAAATLPPLPLLQFDPGPPAGAINQFTEPAAAQGEMTRAQQGRPGQPGD